MSTMSLSAVRLMVKVSTTLISVVRYVVMVNWVSEMLTLETLGMRS